MKTAVSAADAPAAGYGRALRLLDQGDAEGALAQLEGLDEVHRDAAVLVCRARALARLRRFEEAHDALAEALHAEPAHMDAHFALGEVHKQQGALSLAAACFEHVLKQDPSHVDAHYELGWIYQERARLEDALVQLERAYELAPLDLRIANQLAYVLVRMEQFERGIALFESICARVPAAVVRPRINLSNALLRIGRFERALEVIEEILSAEPNNVDARWNRSHLLLGKGRYAEGWRDYEFRILLKSRPARLLPFAHWDGGPLEGKRLLVTAEQGLGDEIMFASCLPEVLARTRELYLECEHRLVPLFARSFPQAHVLGSDHESRPGWLKEAPGIDCFVRAGSLPRHLRKTAAEFPAHRGYLRADDARVAFWRERLEALGEGLKVGLSWRGGSASTRGSMRSLKLRELESLLRVPGCQFVSLQYGNVAADLASLPNGTRLQHWDQAITDYDETAALVCALDLVISVQTALIHLAGALGKPAWVMVPSAPEWRYGTDGERMAWYPSVKLFRQSKAGDWQETIARIACALSDACSRGLAVE